MKYYKNLSLFYLMFAIFSLIVCMVSLSGCSLADSFGNIFDGDDVPSAATYIGESFDYSATTENNAKTFLMANIFMNEAFDIQDSINVVTNSEERSYFFYLESISQARNLYEQNQPISSEEQDGYDYMYRYEPVSVVINSSFFTVETKQMPNHRSNYFFNSEEPNFSANSFTCDNIYCSYKYENKDGGFADRAEIISDNITIDFPLVPRVANSPTSLVGHSIIGLARNGVPLVQYDDMNSYHDVKFKLDEYRGVPRLIKKDNDPDYHYAGYQYFVEPVFFTGYRESGSWDQYDYVFHIDADRSSLIGIAKDGFPIYGPYEFRQERIPTNLDQCRGHVGETGDRFSNTYHYHIKGVNYINDDEENYFIECFSGVLSP